MEIKEMEDIIFNILDEQLNTYKQQNLRAIAHEIDLALDNAGYSDIRGLQDILTMYQTMFKTYKTALFNTVEQYETIRNAEKNSPYPPTEKEVQYIVDMIIQYAEKGELPHIMVDYNE